MQRKVFRIEEAMSRGRAASAVGLSALLDQGKDRCMTRSAGELGAAVEAVEKSTHAILKSAEVIDACAQALAGKSVEEDQRQAICEIQQQLIRIFEACNFQDIVGQRIGKVIETLCRLDGELSSMLAGSGDARHPLGLARTVETDDLLHGPRLDGEAGHASQRDIDALFDY